jgi:fatty-acid desaturase
VRRSSVGWTMQFRNQSKKKNRFAKLAKNAKPRKATQVFLALFASSEMLFSFLLGGYYESTDHARRPAYRAS